MKNYNDFSETFSNSRKNMKWPEIDYFIQFIKSFPGSGYQILDIGCGNGRLLNNLGQLDKKIQYLGIDSSVGMIEEAKKLHKEAEFKVLDMLETESLKQEFDMIFLIASFHHLKNNEVRLKVLENIKKILKIGGYVFMTNWNLFSKENLKKYKETIEGSKNFEIKIGNFSRFYYGFSLDELKDLFLESDFEVIENRIFESERNIISILRN